MEEIFDFFIKYVQNFGQNWQNVQNFGHNLPYSQKIKNSKIRPRVFFDTIQRYYQIKFLSFIFEKKIKAGVILRNHIFVKISQNRQKFVNISKNFPLLPLKSPNFIKTHSYQQLKQAFEHVGSKNRKIWTKETKF